MKRMMLALLVVGGSLVLPRPALAQSTCTVTLYDCYASAAKVDDFWRRWAAGLDCEVDYAACLRDALLAE